jgi:drug/metabolite transporter (DMT)-like permease
MMVYLLGLLSPFAFALGTVMQQRGTLETPAREGDPRFLVQTIRKPVWLIGGFITICAFLLQAAALRYGSLALVQALQVLSLVFALPLGMRLTGQRIGRRSAAGAAITVMGLVVFVLLGQPQGGVSEPGGTAWLVAGIVIVAATAVLSSAAFRRRGAAAAALFATAAGVCFALQAGVTKVLVTRLDDGVVTIVASWPLYVLLFSAAIGFVLQQASLKTGALAPAMAALEAATLAVSVLIGVAVFDEVVSEEGGRALPAVAGLALAIVGVVLLATDRRSVPGGRAGGQFRSWRTPDV